MGTKIPWVRNIDGSQGQSWNPSLGCTKSCPYCYAAILHNRRHAALLAGKLAHECYRLPFDQPVCLPERLARPLKRRKPTTYFVDSAGDLFDPAIPFEFVAAVWGVMAAAPRHRFIVLTKRPERMAEWFRWLQTHLGVCSTPAVRCAWHAEFWFNENIAGHAVGGRGFRDIFDRVPVDTSWPLPNVWLLTTVENQAAADLRIPHLLRCPAAVLGVSVEPCLGPVDLAALFECCCVHRGDYFKAPEQHSWYCPARAENRRRWVIVGSQGGPGAKTMDLAWVRGLRDQAKRYDAAYFYKAGPDAAGRRVECPELDGRTWTEIPGGER